MAELARRMRDIDMIFEAESVMDVTEHPLFDEYESMMMLMVSWCIKFAN